MTDRAAGSAKPVEAPEDFFRSEADYRSPDIGLLSGNPDQNLQILRDAVSEQGSAVSSLPEVSIDFEGDSPEQDTTTTTYGAGFDGIRLTDQQEAQVEETLELGSDALQAVADIGAGKDIRVIAFGETHFDPPMQELTVDVIQQLAGQGFTHLALEIDRKHQDAIDRYMESGDEQALRDEFLSPRFSDYWIPRIAAAREAGLEVVAVDRKEEYGNKPPRIDQADEIARLAQEAEEQRDQSMFESIDAILSGDPDARVILIGGSGHHGSRNMDPEHPTLGELLKDKYPDAVATILSQTTTADVDTLFPFLDDLESRILVPTRDADGAPNAIGDLKRNDRPLDARGSGWYRDWDYVAMFPD